MHAELRRQHNVVPESALVPDVTHVALAFMRSEVFNDEHQSTWPLFTTVDEVRPKFAEGTIIQVAIGGWGNTEGFETAARTEESRTMFADNVRSMLDATGADGVDVDWEYPGGNGEDYKSHTNSKKAWQIEAYPQLLASIRAAIGPSKIISAAVPGLPRDMIAFSHSTIPRILETVDFLNIMTYDLMNRRDNVTKHHTGVQLSREAINTYFDRGVPPEKANFGLAFYVKWFKTAPDADNECRANPVGCKTELMEDPTTGADLGKAGGFSWHDEVPTELLDSFLKALADGVFDVEGGGHYYWDESERLFWSWDTPAAIRSKIEALMQEKKLGGVFAWGLGEDASQFKQLEAANEALKKLATKESVQTQERSEL